MVKEDGCKPLVGRRPIAYRNRINAAASINVPLGRERIRLVRLRYQCISDELKACGQNNAALH